MGMIKEFIDECGGKEKLVGLTTRQVCDNFLIPLTAGKHSINENQYSEIELDKHTQLENQAWKGDRRQAQVIWAGNAPCFIRV